MIVCDASSLVGAAIKPGSTPDRAFEWIEANNAFALSVPVMVEVESVLRRPKLASMLPLDRSNRFIDAIRRAGVCLTPTVRIAACRDPNDDKHLELALAAGAECIISSDNDLRVPHPWRGVPILSPAEFLASR